MHHLVITNQHGDNRGEDDRWPCSATLAGLQAWLAPVRFTVLHQFADPKLPIVPTQDVELVPLAPWSPRAVARRAGGMDRRLGAGRPA